MSETLTPEYVENLIDEAGRDAVFSEARSLGWTSGAPLWVWHNIAINIINSKKEQTK